MDLNKDYYKILGVDKNSDDNQIKKIFRKKANETHPDKHGGDDTDFKKINEAYQILGNKEKRNKYDMQSPHGKNYNPSSGFNSFFGGNPFGNPFVNQNPFEFNFSFGNDSFDPFDIFFRRKNDFHEELDITINKEITLKDIYNNNNINVKYNRKVSCDVCNGSGFDPDSEHHECDVCDGTGRLWEQSIGNTKCRYCQGTGKIHTGTCKKCNGDKVINKEEEFNINNVYKISRNDTKYLKGYGHQSKYYIHKKGNLILNILYIDDNNYQRKNDGLYYKLDLHFEDAIKGSNIEYKHLDDKKYKIKIPAKTKNGDILKMANMGLIINNNIRQNLYIQINIIIDYDRL